MGKEKYVLEVDESRFRNEVAHLKKQVDTLNSKEQLYAGLSKHTGQEIGSIQDFENYLKAKTGFVNIILASQALELEKQYQDALELEKTEVIAKSMVTKKGSEYALKPSVIDEVRERYTIYIDEDKRLKFDAVLDAVEVINSLPPHARGCIKLNLRSEWVINKYRFNSKD